MSENYKLEEIPEGFTLMQSGLGFSDALEPFYIRADEEFPSFGLRVDDQHCNMIGICHGGVVMTLMDVVAGSTLVRRREKDNGAPTMSLSFDFISAAKKGEWIEGQMISVEMKRRFGFVTGFLNGPRGVVARASGTFYFPEKGFKIGPGLIEAVARA
jgi:uncharacterized protein (TIGR00369 family)